MQAIILAGGLGTRLRSLIADLPKPMAPIGEKPFLAFLLDYLRAQGVTEVVLSVGYKHTLIEEYFSHHYAGLKIQYSIEQQPLGTGGAIVQALSYITADKMFIINGDSFLQMNYAAMMEQYENMGSECMLALKQMPDAGRYGSVEVENDRVVSFVEKNNGGAGLISTGVYLCSKKIFNTFTLPTSFSIERDFLCCYINVIKPAAFIVDDYFIDIGIPEDYLRAKIEIPQRVKDY